MQEPINFDASNARSRREMEDKKVGLDIIGDSVAL